VNFASTFGAKVNARLQEISDKVDTLEARMEENAGGLEKVQEKADVVEKKVEEVETVVENMEKQVNDGMYDE
jgi:predicted  nucleic acid-binding Zn-ribbon protein